MDDSAAAIVNTKTGISWPNRSSKYTDEIKKLKFIANKISSIDIIIVKIFFLFKATPTIPVKNRKKGTSVRKTKFIF